jgi:hypothetical protein
MQRKIIYSLAGISICLSVMVFLNLPKAKAAEGDCHIGFCLLSAPVIVMPENNQPFTNTKPVIRGLMMRDYVVKVFLDGRVLEKVEQRNHGDQYASFFAVPAIDLKPGKHYIYTIAYVKDPRWDDQSIESNYIYFEIKPAQKTVVKKLPQQQPVVLSQEINKPAEDSSINNPVQNQSESLKDLRTRKENQNRIVGLILLTLILAILMIWKLVERHRLIKRGLINKFGGKLPPPPNPSI